jgi:hypothetical protein
MLKIRRNIRPRIPNALAAAAAMTLAATCITGAVNHPNRGTDEAALVESQRAPAAHWVTRNTDVEEASTSRVKRKAGFKVNLFLFRHH